MVIDTGLCGKNADWAGEIWGCSLYFLGTNTFDTLCRAIISFHSAYQMTIVFISALREKLQR